MAELDVYEEPTEYGKCWCWIFWHLDVPVASLTGASEICFRAWDDSQNCMPSMPTWNLMGMMNNPWFRIKVHRVPGEESIWFEHPTRVEPTAGTVWPFGETMHLVNGEVASPGWAERMQKEYSFAHLPQEKHEEVPDPVYAWEVEIAHKLKGLASKEKVRVTPQTLETVTKATLEAHAGENWMAIHGLVYDVTGYLNEHPGGSAILTPLNGKDASDEFEEAGHTKLSRKEVDRLVLKGVLEGFEDNMAKLRTIGWEPADGIPTEEQLASAKKGPDEPPCHLTLGSLMDLLGRILGIVSPPARPAALDPGAKVKLALKEKVKLTHDSVRYTFALPSPEHRLGLPIGQHVHLSTMMRNPRTGGELKYTSRQYTPTSNDDDLGIVEFVIKTYYKDQHPKFPDGGWLSQYMDGMKLGDTLDFRGPLGKIIYKGSGIFSIRGEEKRYRNIGLISGGVGITPCYQLMKYADQKSEPLEISLLFGNQSEEDILLKSELDDLSTRGMKVTYTVDRVKKAWGGLVGFINKEMVKNALPPPGDDTLVLACGPPVMLEKCVHPICQSLGYTAVVDF